MNQKSVASAHFLSTKAGTDILSLGGNAYDAAIATSAALTVVQPHLNGLGGDFFAVLDDNGMTAINGNGYAAELATIDFFRSRGYTELPKRGHLASFSIPGLVSSWSILSENATLPMKTLLQPAIKYAREGFNVTPSLARGADLTSAGDDDWNRIYKPVAGGGVLFQRELANTLATVSSDKGHSFYHGEIARAIEKDMISKGGLVRFGDLDGFEAKKVNPLRGRYRGFDIYTNPPSSQGATALMWLNMLDRKNLSAMSKDEYYSALLSTMRTAYAYRAKYIADPKWLPFDEEMLRPGYEYAEGGVLDEKGVSVSDTTAFSVYDGTVGISAIQSNYMGFGSGHNIKGTGINMNNRGVYFTLDASHHNALTPGKKTFHTLMAVVAKGARTIYTGAMGGDVQPQVNVQVLSNVIDKGMGMQSSVAAPRFGYPASIYADSDIFYERALRLRVGREVEDMNSMMGHAQGILVSDIVEAGFDPRGDAMIRYD